LYDGSVALYTCLFCWIARPDPFFRFFPYFLKLLFEGVKRLTPEEKHLVKELIEGVILKHEARRWTAPASGG